MKKAILVLMILASCGGDEGWSDEARASFIAGCTEAGGTESACECVQEKLEEAQPDEDAEDFDQELITEFTVECAK